MRKIPAVLLTAVLVAAAMFAVICAIPAEFDKNDTHDRFKGDQEIRHLTLCAEKTSEDSDSDGVADCCDQEPDKANRFYNRSVVREYAKAASEELQNGTFRYLSPAQGDSATNCANFVSQCLYAGGFEMNEEWYMKKYSGGTSSLKRLSDKITTTAERFVSGSFGIGNANDYTDMDYKWSLIWSCAGDQLEYGTEHFFEGKYEVNTFDEFYEIIRKAHIETGDVIYQSVGNIHHVVIISDIDEEGTVYIASHNPPLFDCRLDEDGWKKHGFQGGAVIAEVKDICE